MIRRRAFITLLGGAAAAWPLAAGAQQPDGMRRIGVLVGLAEDDPEIKARLAAFRQGLEKRGWSEGRNVRIDYRFAPASAHVQVLAKELIALQPDVILTHTTPITAALQRENRAIPIVFAGVADPIGSGFIASLARPGGNITGDLTATFHRDLIIALAARHRLPAVYPFRYFVADGGLMSYGNDFVDAFRQAASYVDRILRGDKPADLPVQAATKFETIINLKTAKALDLTVPPGLLVAADEVIE
jgi:ABC-type uncharacterized transport system substrate-binding protein